jgi:glucose/arabinose dehydrogenase
MKFVAASLSTLSLAALVLFAAKPPAADPKLPEPYATPSSRNNAKVVPRPEGAQLHAPAGFKVEGWASGFQRPRYMILGPSGELILSDSAEGNLVAESAAGLKKDLGTIYVFPGRDPQKRIKLITGLDRPYGLALWHEYLYVAEPAGVERYKYDAKNFKVGEAERIINFEGFDKGGHWTRGLLFDDKGQKLYVSVGSGSNVDAGEDPRRAAISRYNPDGSSHEIFAAGTRNPVSIHWYPGTQTLWASVQERDLLGDDLVPDYFTHIEKGAFYGWPYAYFGKHEDPRRKGERPDLVAQTTQPDLALGSHVAVLDFTFYTGNQFPAKYKGGAFLAFHGSWNRAKRVGQSIAFVPFQNGQPSGDPEPFLTGWMISPDSTDVWGRPVGVLQLPDGSLLVSDDGGKKIWRVSYGK